MLVTGDGQTLGHLARNVRPARQGDLSAPLLQLVFIQGEEQIAGAARLCVEAVGLVKDGFQLLRLVRVVRPQGGAFSTRPLAV